MRPGPNSKRGRGRGNGRKPSSRSQTVDSNGPNVRIRGNAYQVLEKYLALARDASASGDRISAENYYQHAEHYYRIVNAANATSGSNGGQGRPNVQSTPEQPAPPQRSAPQPTDAQPSIEHPAAEQPAAERRSTERAAAEKSRTNGSGPRDKRNGSGGSESDTADTDQPTV